MPKRTRTHSSPEFAYLSLFAQVRLRLMHYHKLPSMPIDDGGELPIVPAEWLALQVRKICEAVAFAAVTANELSTGETSARRGKDPIDSLKLLKKRAPVALPRAVEVQSGAFQQITYHTVPGKDWSAEQVLAGWRQASDILHVRHPEDAQAVWLNPRRAKMEEHLSSLKDWLWTHTIDYQQQAILIQMGRYPDNFLTHYRPNGQALPDG